LPAGEENKTWESCQTLFQFLITHNADRKTGLVALGGGMVTDLVGFCASIYKRGIDCCYIPTSLLAMADATVGGKTGIDFMGLKNVLGTFKEANEIHILPQFLDTLPKDELLSGLAEMIKHYLIKPANPSFWAMLKEVPISAEKLVPYLADTIAFKTEVVEEDPQEADYRKVLNTGHTIGHAIESWFLAEKKPIPHGWAIAAGLFCENELYSQSSKSA
jgi:3-dehydroquinate synthase